MKYTVWECDRCFRTTKEGDGTGLWRTLEVKLLCGKCANEFKRLERFAIACENAFWANEDFTKAEAPNP